MNEAMPSHRPVVEPEARAVLTRFDARGEHADVLVATTSPASSSNAERHWAARSIGKMGGDDPT